MNSHDAYQSWLAMSRSVEPSAGFAQDVMKQISLDNRRPGTAKPGLEIFQRWLEWVTHRPLVQAALLVVALIAGAARLLVTWQIILSF
jgi:hypothetical protein